MTPAELAAELGVDPKTLRSWLRQLWPREEAGARWELTPEQVERARQRWSPERPAPHTQMQPGTSGVARGARGGGRDADYVLDLIDEILGQKSQREHRFPWLLGDPDVRGKRVALPVDGYWPSLHLVVEYRERQHDEPVAHFDKPDRLTVSGVHRGEQRRRYDELRDREIPANGLHLLVIRPAQLDANSRGRLRQNADYDRAALEALINTAALDGSDASGEATAHPSPTALEDER